MKYLGIFAFSFLISGLTCINANAESYQLSVQRQQVCELMGNVAVMGSDARKKNKTREDLMKQADNDQATFDALIVGYDLPNHEDKDIYMQGWARCMDKYAPKN